MDRSQYSARKLPLALEGRGEDDYSQMTPGERLDVVEELTLTAWEFRTGSKLESRLRRDVGRVIRGAR